MAIVPTIIETFEVPTSYFKYAVTIRPLSLRELDQVHEWLHRNIPRSEENMRWVSFAKSQVCFKHERDRDWFLLKWMK